MRSQSCLESLNERLDGSQRESRQWEVFDDESNFQRVVGNIVEAVIEMSVDIIDTDLLVCAADIAVHAVDSGLSLDLDTGGGVAHLHERIAAAPDLSKEEGVKTTLRTTRIGECCSEVQGLDVGKEDEVGRGPDVEHEHIAQGHVDDLDVGGVKLIDQDIRKLENWERGGGHGAKFNYVTANSEVWLAFVIDSGHWDVSLAGKSIKKSRLASGKDYWTTTSDALHVMNSIGLHLDEADLSGLERAKIKDLTLDLIGEIWEKDKLAAVTLELEGCLIEGCYLALGNKKCGGWKSKIVVADYEGKVVGLELGADGDDRLKARSQVKVLELLCDEDPSLEW